METCRNIHTLAVANATDLIPYGIDTLMLTTFDTAIQLFDVKVPEPSNARAHSAMLTWAIAAKDKEITRILKNRLDKTIHLLETTHPDFVTEYFNARKIIDLGIRHTDQTVPEESPDVMGYMTGVIRDKSSLEFLEGVIVKFTSNLTGMEYQFETDEDGEYFADDLPQGIYKVSVEYPTYTTQEFLNIEVNTNDELSMDVDLEADVPLPE